jgi:acetoin utilization deacetylase AcuC-like enzyme
MTYTPTKKVLIFDWDLHHGNGTESLVRNNKHNDVYYISMHLYENNFYPYTGNTLSDTDNIKNIPLDRNTTNDIFVRQFTIHVIPMIIKIIDSIDMIIISNGLDAHKDDPLQCMNLTDDVYVEITEYFKSLDKKTVFLLEGGYNPNVIASVSHSIISSLS